MNPYKRGRWYCNSCKKEVKVVRGRLQGKIWCDECNELIIK